MGVETERGSRSSGNEGAGAGAVAALECGPEECAASLWCSLPVSFCLGFGFEFDCCCCWCCLIRALGETEWLWCEVAATPAL